MSPDAECGWRAARSATVVVWTFGIVIWLWRYLDEGKPRFLYLLAATLIHYVERLIDFWRQTGSLVAGNQKLLAEMVWPHFWAIQLILLVLIAMYCTIHELVRVIGRDKLLRIFFGPLPVAQV